MPVRSLWVGLDVGADEMAVCCTDGAGGVLFEEQMATDAAGLHRRLKSQRSRIACIALESGSSGIVLTRSLKSLGYPVAMFDARQASKFLGIRRNKTDKNDARGLADIARLGRDSVSEVRLRSPECQRLRSTLITRQKLVRLRMALEASIRSLFRLNGGKLRSCYSAASFKRAVSEEIRRLRKTAQLDLTDDLEPLIQLSIATRSYLEKLDKSLAARAQEDLICQRFLEVPGVGPITALCFYCAIEDPHRFHRNSDVGAYLGLVPRIRQSGHTIERYRISKMGDALTRRYLTTAAQLHYKHGNSRLAAWAETLSLRLDKGGVYVALARKLAVTMLAMWKTGERFQPFYEINLPQGGVAGWETATTFEDASDPALG